MSEPILHHYDLSPYAEKIRLIMGYKGLAWKSVVIPMVMPKPDLTCLTGGYRKTPVLQIGADIYCDTKTIARALERLRPQPTLYPANTEASERALSSMGDAMFLMGVILMLGAGMMPEEFIEDRKKMFPGSFNMEQIKQAQPSKRDQIRVCCAAIEAQLADGRPFLLGSKVSLADFSVCHPLWFMSVAPPTAGILAPYKRLTEWRDRITAIGHGTRTEITADEAIEIARDAAPATEERVDAAEPNGYKSGDRITVMPEDYGLDPVTGELVYSDAYEIAVRRTDPRVGEVVVHFPRQGYLSFRAA
jgi:glutathione S-transferase